MCRLDLRDPSYQTGECTTPHPDKCQQHSWKVIHWAIRWSKSVYYRSHRAEGAGAPGGSWYRQLHTEQLNAFSSYKHDRQITLTIDKEEHDSRQRKLSTTYNDHLSDSFTTNHFGAIQFFFFLATYLSLNMSIPKHQFLYHPFLQKSASSLLVDQSVSLIKSGMHGLSQAWHQRMHTGAMLCSKPSYILYYKADMCNRLKTYKRVKY